MLRHAPLRLAPAAILLLAASWVVAVMPLTGLQIGWPNDVLGGLGFVALPVAVSVLHVRFRTSRRAWLRAFQAGALAWALGPINVLVALALVCGVLGDCL